MITIRKSSDRGHADHGWLNARHTFSFADYHDPDHMGFRDLRVINEDRVQPGKGFGTHGHRDMEIVTVVLEGELQHQDSMGNGSVIGPGDVQRMSAGKGVLHSEVNPSSDAPVHLLQIWILPRSTGGPPGYEERKFSDEELSGRLRLVASPDGEDDSLSIGQDVRILRGRLAAGTGTLYELAADRHAWLQVMRGGLSVNGTRLEVGDGAAISAEARLALEAHEDADLLLFDLR